MTFKKLISLINPIDISGPEPEAIGKLTQDSRSAGENSVFIAVKGLKVDGHDFIEEAAGHGASVIICEEIPEGLENVCILQVKNTRSLAGALAQAFKGDPAEALKIVGITGTNGKTTVATLTYQVLQKLGAQASLLGTVEKRINDKVLESRLTTADPIELAADMRQMIEAGSTHLVMEVSSHALHQKRVEGIDFDVAAFTNISHDHLDYHENMDEYATAKKMLFDGLAPKASAIINTDSPYSAYVSSECDAKIINFSFEENRSIYKIVSNSAKGLEIKVEAIKIKSPLAGKFNAYNIAEAFLICRELEYEEKEIAQALETATGAPGRMERVQTDEAENQAVVLVDYAHTPAALENVLQALVEIKKVNQTLYVVFGCGGDRDKTKRPKMASVAEKYADHVTVTSDNPRSEDPDSIIDDAMKGFSETVSVTRITGRQEAIEDTIAKADENSIILVAGKGHETYQEIKGERHHFDDREVAAKALGKRNGNPKPQEVH